MSKRIIIKGETGINVGRLDPHPTGNGYVGVPLFVAEPVDYFGLEQNTALRLFSQYCEKHGCKLRHPSGMFDWMVTRDGNGFFIALPFSTVDERDMGDRILLKHLPATECWKLTKRANEVRSFFGPRMNECTLEQVWQLEARMADVKA